jgi:hypothetical protein
MNTLNLMKLVLVLFGVVLIAGEVWLIRRRQRPVPLAAAFLAGCSALCILFLVYLWINHITYPLHLDLMEGTVWQHFQRAAAGLPVYPQPAPDYVPLAYNVLFYYLAVPFSWVLGSGLFTLRLVAILGMAGSGCVLYEIVRRETRSRWWGLLALGLFAAAYRVMDAYLDTAHSDSWLLCSALLGSYLIYRNRSRVHNLLGVLLLVAAFWFKQHGALFVLGGLVYLTWREGPRRSWPYWAVSALLGPVAYVFAGPALFGSQFLYFTWEVPRHWSEFNLAAVRRLVGFVGKSYPFLAAAAVTSVVWKGWRERTRLTVWDFQLVSALFTGLMGSLDAGSSNNVYIPMGTWFILSGTLGLHAASQKIRAAGRFRLQHLALLLSLALLLYDPRSMILPPAAGDSYADLLGLLRGLDGTVYAPDLGQLSRDFTLYPAAHWVALEDMIRGPGRDEHDSPVVRALLMPALDGTGPTYVLVNWPLEDTPLLEFLSQDYTLLADYGGRFTSLAGLPKRFDHGYPRYLYGHTP